MRGKFHGAVWRQYQQEPQPGVPDYVTLPTKPRLDMLGLIPCFWLEAERLPHLPRPFCCQHLAVAVLPNWILSVPGSWLSRGTINAHLTQSPLVSLILRAKIQTTPG